MEGRPRGSVERQVSLSGGRGKVQAKPGLTGLLVSSSIPRGSRGDLGLDLRMRPPGSLQAFRFLLGALGKWQRLSALTGSPPLGADTALLGEAHLAWLCMAGAAHGHPLCAWQYSKNALGPVNPPHMALRMVLL